MIKLLKIGENKEKLPELVQHQGDVNKALLNVMADLREVSVRNEAILASIADGVMVVDKNGVITLANHSAERLLGRKTNELIGKKWHQILEQQDEEGQPILPEEQAIRNALINKAITQPSIPDNVCYYVRKDGTKFPVARTVSPIILTEKVVGAVNVFRDITGEKELEMMKDSFMDIAAHDLRTPAAAIRGFISRVLDGDAGEINKKTRELLKGAYDGNLHMIHLIEDFLMVSRLERGKIKIKPKKGDLGKIIEDTVDGLLNLVKLKGLKLRYEKVKLPTVLVDEERIIQVLNNLISNAIKFTEKGSVTIEHKISKNEVITNITDTGIGISAKAQKLLFQKYYKGDQEKKASGLGLGLYISKLCVEGLGGKIWAESQEGKGSTFSFSLPVTK